MSMNKKLQSIDEELRLVNEKLTAVNSVLQCKLDVLERDNDNLSNLLSSMDIATIFLNREMKIMLFNPATAKLLSLRESDIDRPISDFSAKVANDNLLQDAQQVLETLSPVERDIKSIDLKGETKEAAIYYLRRIVPYLASDDLIVGVVVIYVEITERYCQKRLLEEYVIDQTKKLYERDNRLQAIMNHASEAIIVINQLGVIIDFNQSAEKMFGYSSAEIIGNNIKRLMPSQFNEEQNKNLQSYMTAIVSQLTLREHNIAALRKDGNQFPIEFTVNQVDNLDIYVGIIRDLSEQRALRKAITEIDTYTQEKLGMELHDCVGQRLTGINLLLKNFQRDLHRDNKPDLQIIDEIREQLRLAIGETRDMSHGLAPLSFTPDGLQQAILHLAESINNSDVHCQFDCSMTTNIKDRMIANQIYRIVQEACNNTLKHANAKNITITLTDRNGKLEWSIVDDGIGFKLSKENYKNGIGIQIMQYRAESIGANLKMITSPGKGTSVYCIL